MLSIPIALGEIAEKLVFFLAVRAQAQGLILELLLLAPRQEEALVGELSNVVNHAYPVVDVAAIEHSDVFVRYQHALAANGADAVTKLVLLLFVSVPLLCWKVLGCHAHGLWLRRIEHVLELWKSVGLNLI